MPAPKPIEILIEGIKTPYETELISPATIGSTITVKSILSFAINQILLIGELGAEDSEIVKTHASTAPTGSTITLTANLSFAHPVRTKVTVLIADQVEITHSTNEAGTTKTGLTTTLGSGLVALKGDNKVVRWDDTEYNTGYYWLRYKNSITGAFSDYSGAYPVGGLEDNTVGKMIERALKVCHIDAFTKFVDYEFCINEINECLRAIAGKLKKHSKLGEFEYVLGQTTRGINKYALPSTISENENNKSMYNVRIGDTELKFKTISEWNNDIIGNTKHTQVRTQATAGQTTLEIDNSYDFMDSGSVNVFISGTIYTITYTGITRSAIAGVLTGIPASGTGSITVTIPVDTNVWYGENEVKPEFYTIYGGYLYIELPSATYDNLNVVISFGKSPTKVSEDTDTLDATRYDAVFHWLVWAIKAQIKNKGERSMDDDEYKQFLQITADYIRTENAGHRRKNYPRVNGIVI